MNFKQDLDWFEEQHFEGNFKKFEKKPVAYFCAEYALNKEIPTYSGGLGVLAGDVVREAADRNFPFVAIGLYYYEGYVCNTDETLNACVRICPDQVGLCPVMNEHGERVIASVPIQDREVKFQAWEYKQGENSIYLLDTNIQENDSDDRKITNRLYVADKEMRLKQEIILGIGGLRFLKKLGVHPSVFHLNEGHSAMLMFELIKHEMEERKISFDQAKQFAERRTVFTNHTLVAAGHETYNQDLVSLLLCGYAQQICVPVSKLIELGLVQESSMFSMTILALRTTGIINAVSKLHAKKALDVWADHHMVGITNGVHTGKWDLIKSDVSKLGSFWEVHQKKKRLLLDYLKQELNVEWDENELLIGWARRFVMYKRPLAILEDLENFKRIAESEDRPVRLVVSGIPHPDDKEGIAMLEKLKSLVSGELEGSVAYIPHYKMDIAKLLIAGCDVWMNTPILGFEACGTSGMKAAMNGVLPFSTKDGWIDEVDLWKVGWPIEDYNINASILGVIENDILPIYYDRNSDGVPELWEEHMQNARNLAMNRFSATRMFREYVEMLYL